MKALKLLRASEDAGDLGPTTTFEETDAKLKEEKEGKPWKDLGEEHARAVFAEYRPPVD